MDSRHPVSDGQRALWLLHQRNPDAVGPAYTIAAAGRVRGTLEEEALRGAFDALVRRHGALRTVFPAEVSSSGETDEPVQRVVPPEELGDRHFEEVDGSSWPPGDVPERLADLAYRPFDLTRGPLFRVALVRRGDERIVHLSMHHLVADLWSLAIVVRELGRAYGSLAAGRAADAELDPVPVTHGAWMERRRAALDGEEGDRLRRFWDEHLATVPPPLDLPTDRPRPPVQTFSGGVAARSLDPEPGTEGEDRRPRLRRSLGRLARHAGTNRFTALLAAYQTVLARWSGQDDFLVGSPTAGRGDVRGAGSELAGVVGYFVNPVAIRAPLAGDPTFAELLERLGAETEAVLAHQDLPFPRVVERAREAGLVERDPSRPPLFQTLFVLQKSPLPGTRGLGAFALGREGAPLDLGALVLESVPMPQRGAQFDFALYVTDEGGELFGSLELNDDLFERTTAERFLGHLASVLDAAVEDPDRRISELPLMTAEERAQVLGPWARGGREGDPAPVPHLLHERFLCRADEDPGEEALVWEGDEGVLRISRGEVARRSARVAAALETRGIGPETTVGVFMERTPEMVIALLGVLRAGGAYVPLDPGYPRDRVALMIEDSAMAAVIVGPGLEERLPDGDAARLSPARLEAEGEIAPEAPAEGAASSDNLAFVIYTSGSTGRPKGVAITHRSASALLDWAGQAFAPEELSGVLAATSVCFDLSVFELFAPLSLGGRVVLARDALALPTLSVAGEVTLVNTVPSAMEGLCREGSLPDGVRTVCLAGEPLRRSLVDAVYDAGPGVRRVLNLYGPSEDTTYSTEAACDRSEDRVPAPEPTIGRVLPGGRSYVVDPGLRPVPAGVPGELVLAGVGLARGYLGRPARSAESFVPDPFGADGDRLYRTGDLARWLPGSPEGELELLGRLDHQVKVRGFRIELGEVEAALERHDEVRESAVVVDGEAAGRSLIAYVALQEGSEDAEGGSSAVPELRAALGRTLPAYMVPDVFVVLDALPRTPNGKVDRDALPEPDRSGIASSAELVAPETEVEKILAAIWCEVLEVERVGIHDSFFELGGHSLTAHRVLVRVRETFGVDVPTHRLFEKPTVAGLEVVIAEALMADADEETVAEVMGSLE